MPDRPYQQLIRMDGVAGASTGAGQVSPDGDDLRDWLLLVMIRTTRVGTWSMWMLGSLWM